MTVDLDILVRLFTFKQYELGMVYYNNNWLRFLFAAEAIALKQQISKIICKF